MASVSWPASLQQIWNRNGFNLVPENVRQLSPFEIGPTKARKIATRPRYAVNANIWVTTVEYTTLNDFYHTTLNSGTMRFDHPHPIDGVTYDWFFIGTGINYTPLGGDLYRASFNLLSQ